MRSIASCEWVDLVEPCGPDARKIFTMPDGREGIHRSNP